MHCVAQSILWVSIMIDNGLHEASIIVNTSELSKQYTRMEQTKSFWDIKIVYIGMLIGAFTSLFMIDRIGRVTTLLTTGFPKIFAWFLLDFENPLYVFFGRIIAGIGCGMVYVALPIYLCEMTPKESRGSIGMLMGMFLKTGIIFFFLSLSNFSQWTPMIMVTILPFVYWACQKWTTESPEFFADNGHLDLAEETFQSMLQKEDIEDEMMELINRMGPTYHKISFRRALTALFEHPENGRALTIVNTLMCGIALTGWFPIVIFQYLGFGSNMEKNVFFSNVIYAATTILSAAASIIILPTYGRKSILLASYYTMFSATLLAIIHVIILHLGLSGAKELGPFGFFACGVVYAIGYGLGADSLPFVYIGEVFPSEVKTIGVVICTLFYISLKMIMLIICENVLISNHPIVILGYVAIMLAAILYCIVRRTPNNEGKSLFEIQMDLRYQN